MKGFRFLVVNDLHHASTECTPFLEALVAHMRGRAPFDFCLIVGDLADQGARESLVAVREAFAPLGVPIHSVPGNHDCDVGENNEIYASVFPEKINYTFVHRGWQFVGLDTTDGNKWKDTRIGAAANAFLDAAVPTLDRKAPTILFTHFPMAEDVRMASLSANEVLGRFDGLDLRCVFSGHYHARTERARRSAVVTTNTCCARVRGPHDGTTDEGCLLCTAHGDGRLEREFVPFAPAVTRV
ncbi:MAG: metallophosphoesterase family protein [Opitutaceae bacterium]